MSLQTINTRLAFELHRVRSYLSRPWLIVQTRPVVVSTESLCEDPIFLVGVHRSGTSLCRRILDSHSGIACPPESFFLKYFAEMLRDPQTFDGFAGMGYLDRASVIDNLRTWASRYHETYRKARNKRRWADKTPQYIEILPELEELYGPQCQYVMIFRHPLDTIHSLFRRGWTFGSYHPNQLINTALYVAKALDGQLRFMIGCGERCFKLYYEELIIEPEGTLRELFAFLHEPWEASVLDYQKFEHNFGTEDPVVRGAQGFHRNFGNWKSLSEDKLASIMPIVEEVSAKLGYSPERMEPTRRTSVECPGKTAKTSPSMTTSRL